jgi:predicted helicase
MSDSIKMIKAEQESFKGLCDFISGKLDTEKGKEIVSNTVKNLRLGITDLCNIINAQNVREMLVIHMATLPIYDALFGDRARKNVMHLILNKAVCEINDMILDGKK